MNKSNCFFGCVIFNREETYLAFIDGCAEQIICATCARDIDKFPPRGMTFIIGKIGTKEIAEYIENDD